MRNGSLLSVALLISFTVGCYDSSGLDDTDAGTDADRVDTTTPPPPPPPPPRPDRELEFSQGQYDDSDCENARLWFPVASADVVSCETGSAYLEVTGPPLGEEATFSVGPRREYEARYCDRGRCEDLVGELNVFFFEPGEIGEVSVSLTFPDEESFEAIFEVTVWCGFCLMPPPPPPPPPGVNGTMFTVCTPDDRPYEQILLPPFETPESLLCGGPEGGYVEIVLPALVTGGVYDLTEPRGFGRGAVGQLCDFEGDRCTDFIGGQLEVGIFEPGEFLFGEITDGFASPGISFNYQLQAFYCSDEC